MQLAFRVDRQDGRSQFNFYWPDFGPIEAPGPVDDKSTDACPRFVGDGICLARTWHGAASGNHKAEIVRFVAYHQGDVLGENLHKMRVRRAYVVDVVPIRDVMSPGADLKNAYLSCADLQGIDLRGANLRGANLRGANLQGANLDRSNLYAANLHNANLRNACLVAANLNCANLTGVDLTDVNLVGAVGAFWAPTKGE